MLGVKGKPAPVYLIYWKKESRTFSLIEYDPYQAPSQQDGVRSPGAKPCHKQNCVQRLRLHAFPRFLRFLKISEEHLHYLHLLAICSHLLMCTITATPSLSPSSPVVYYAHGYYQIQLLWKIRKKN